MPVLCKLHYTDIMITILDKHNCCGCEACVQRCPKQCIAFNEDDEGFRYPRVDASVCIDCGLCKKVCPVINQLEPHPPLETYAVINTDEIKRAQSSSGGVFTAIAERVLEMGGVVYGARFNRDWEVEHTYIDAASDLHLLMGSKYVQSRIGETFIQVENFLKTGRVVLFSGTSCQIAGLKCFLRKSYDNLFTVDVVCHGVPSPKLWRDYLETVSPSSEIEGISMKDKTHGWRGYYITIKTRERVLSERASLNKYMLSFSQNISLRPSCYNCPAKAGKSGSDVTLADYWGIEKLLPDMDDNKGTSFVCANSEKGSDLIHSLKLKMAPADYWSSVPFNACIERSTSEPETREAFWQDYRIIGINALMTLIPVKSNIVKRVLRRIKTFLK